MAAWPCEPTIGTGVVAGEHISADSAEMQLFTGKQGDPCGCTWTGYGPGTLEVGKVCPPIARREAWLLCCSHADADWRTVRTRPITQFADTQRRSVPRLSIRFI